MPELPQIETSSSSAIKNILICQVLQLTIPWNTHRKFPICSIPRRQKRYSCQLRLACAGMNLVRIKKKLANTTIYSI